MKLQLEKYKCDPFGGLVKPRENCSETWSSICEVWDNLKSGIKCSLGMTS